MNSRRFGNRGCKQLRTAGPCLAVVDVCRTGCCRLVLYRRGARYSVSASLRVHGVHPVGAILIRSGVRPLVQSTHGLSAVLFHCQRPQLGCCPVLDECLCAKDQRDPTSFPSCQDGQPTSNRTHRFGLETKLVNGLIALIALLGHCTSTGYLTAILAPRTG